MEFKMIRKIEKGRDRWIEVLQAEDGKTVYRVCGQGGAIARYTSDLWQAHVFVEYY